MFPLVRLRRNRQTDWVRDLIAENYISAQDLILPIFVIEGENKKQEISTIPGVFRQSIDSIITTAQEAQDQGIKAIALFPCCINQELKTNNGIEGYNDNNLICRAIRALKKHTSNIGIICDVALDPYTIHGHDGVIVNNLVDNDLTIKALEKQALVYAQAGADIIAPSDMMDGRIIAIRNNLDKHGYYNLNILSYSVKYNSSLYQPFREAIKSNSNKKISKATYQMDIRNKKEALREIEQDISEGADIIMIKPAIFSLDVIDKASSNFNIPIFAYQVSGEYAMIKFAAMSKAIEWPQVMIESLISIKRAGASAIFSYAANDIINHIKKL